MIIFAIGPEEKWNEDAEEFEGIDNTKIEAYSVPGNLKKYFDRAKNYHRVFIKLYRVYLFL